MKQYGMPRVWVYGDVRICRRRHRWLRHRARQQAKREIDTELEMGDSNHITKEEANSEEKGLLRSLYDEMHELNRRKRLSGLTAVEIERLDFLLQEVDRLESKESLQRDPEIDQRIGELESVLGQKT